MLRNNLGLQNLIKNLVYEKVISNKFVEEVMLSIDRADFTDKDPYRDCPQGIGYCATISAPHMHAHALVFL